MMGFLGSVGVSIHLILSSALFVIGAGGMMLNRGSVILSVMSLELMFLAPVINFVVFSVDKGDLMGQVFSLFILGVVAGEAVIGLALLLAYYRNKGDIHLFSMDTLKG